MFTTRTIAAGLFVFAAACAPAHAQFLDLSHIRQQNLAWEDQFYKWAWQQSVQLGKTIPPGQLPFNAMTLSQANQQTSQAYAAYNQNWHKNSNATSNAISNWTTGAIRGQGPYYNPQTGQMYQLPWTHNNYHVGPYGYVYPGAAHPHHGTTLYPYAW